MTTSANESTAAPLALAAPPPADPRHAAVLAEIERLQGRQSGVGSAVLILIASLALFMGTGGIKGSGARAQGGGFSLQNLLILVGVLLLHEIGHWVAMRGFGYRNLRMFFIPFLGAAVTGRHYNVPGWKKAVVSLSGPLPGIAVGAMVGVAAIVTHRPLLGQIALTALILNGFNLLPLLPLDGGWVVQAILASRHVAFEVTFRLLAVAGLLALSIATGSRFLPSLAVAMLITLPAAYKVARISAEMRRSGLETASPDDQTIPRPAADAIVARVLAAFPPRMTPKVAARYAVQIFESLNARPPGLLGSLGMAALQGAALVVAVFFTAMVVFAQNPSLAAAALSRPPHRLDAASLGVAVGPAASTVTGSPHATVVASFTSAPAARAAAAALEAQPPEGGAVRLFGESVLLALPDDAGARRQWLERLQARTSDVFVSTAQIPARLRVTCTAPSEAVAQAVEQELGDYFPGSRMRLVPPWMEPDPRPPEARAAHARARHTLARLQRAGSGQGADLTTGGLLDRIQAARRAGDAAEVERLRAEQAARQRDARRAALDAAGAEPGADPEVVVRYRALAGAGGAVGGERMTTELRPLLGQLPAQPPVAADGYVTRQGSRLDAPYLRLASTFEAAPAIAGWLLGRGCKDLRYQLTAGFETSDRGADDDE